MLNFALWGFCELRLLGILGSSPPSLCVPRELRRDVWDAWRDINWRRNPVCGILPHPLRRNRGARRRDCVNRRRTICGERGARFYGGTTAAEERGVQPCRAGLPRILGLPGDR